MESIKRSKEIIHLRQAGKGYTHPLVVLIALHKEDNPVIRIGISAGRAVGNAVQRNRAKRLLRAALKCSSTTNALPAGWDFLFLARRPILKHKCQTVQSALVELLRRATVTR